MDDFHLFVSVRAQIGTSVGEAGAVFWHREYESLGVGPSRRLRSHDKELQCESRWHQALERIEERRRWRKASTHLSEAVDRWRAGRGAKGSEDAERSQSIVYEQTTEARLSVSAAPAGYTEIKVTTATKQSVIEVSEVSADVDGLEPVQFGDDTAAAVEPPVTPNPKLKPEHASSKPAVLISDTVTTVRLINTPSTVATSPVTPVSGWSNGPLDDTPATPGSTPAPPRRAKRNAEPESPLSKPPSYNDRSSAPPVALKPFEYPQFPDDAFNPQTRNAAGDQSTLSRPHRSARSRLPSTGPERHLGDTDVARTLFSRAQAEARSEASARQIDSLQTKSSTLGGRLTNTTHFETIIKREPLEEPPSYGGSTENHTSHSNEARGSFTKTEAFSRSHLQQSPHQTLAQAVIVTRSAEFESAMKLYDQATDGNARRLFSSDPGRCFATTKAGARCRIRLETSTGNSLRQAIEKLENCDYTTDHQGCRRLAEELVMLSLCRAESWPGHMRSNKNKILSSFERAVRESLLSSQKTSISSAAKLSVTASYSEMVTTTTTDTFTGFEPWQPTNLASQDVGSCLRALAGKDLGLKYDFEEGYIYAYRADGIFGHVKVGFTTRTIEKRLDEWRVKCGHHPQSILGSARRVPHIARVEELIHTELKDYRRIQTKCGCDVVHNEWFEVSHGLLRAVVEKWSAWMVSRPYDTRGRLKPQNPDMMKEVCMPVPHSVATGTADGTQSRHVRPLEKAFSFVGKTGM